MKMARLLREAKGLTLGQVYKLTDVDDSHLSKYERGLVELSLPNMRTLAALYGCTLDDLDADIPDDSELEPEPTPAPVGMAEE